MSGKITSGKFGYAAGAAATVTPVAGSKVRKIRATGAAGATLVIKGGDSIPLPAGTNLALDFDDELDFNGTQTLVFTSTTSYFVEYALTAA